MNTQALGVEHYLAGMRAALDDLPPQEVGEIMEDVTAHVAELSTELGEDETLEQRLGPPEQYAQELRQAAGYPPRTERLPVTTKTKWLTRPRAAAWGLVLASGITLLAGSVALREPAILLLPGVILVLSLALVHDRGPAQPEVMNLPEAHKLRQFFSPEEGTPAERALSYLKSLQPAWWLVRAGLLGLGAVLLAARDLLGFLLVAAIAVVSVFAGPRAKVDRRWLWFSVPASALAVGLLFSVVGVAADQLRFGSSGAVSYQQSYRPQEYENIYAYDENGKLLNNILLYDQDGQPINAPRNGNYGCDGNPMSSEEPIPANRYPRPKIDYTNGRCYTVTPSVPPPSSVPGSGVPGSGAPLPSNSDAPSNAPSTTAPPTSVSPSK